MTDEAKRIVRMLRALADKHEALATSSSSETERIVQTIPMKTLRHAADWIERGQHFREIGDDG